MTTTAFSRLMVTAALLVSPAAASARAPSTVAQVAENSAASAPAAATDSKATPAAAVDKKICKQLPSSYSRMTTRTCLTEKEWQQVEKEAQN